MSSILEKHKALTPVRANAYAELFGCRPSTVFPAHSLFMQPDARFLIDVFVYPQETESGRIEVAVTNGMSDERMADADHSQQWRRRELIQYFRKCTEDHARQLHGMAWLPLFDGFYLDSHHSVGSLAPAADRTPWRNAFFLLPIVKSHREFVFHVEGDRVSFLWHIPISDEERAYKQEHGANALIDRLEAVNLPWVFDEENRPPLLE
jgi:Suppressor of fused protein (SUFU)